MKTNKRGVQHSDDTLENVSGGYKAGVSLDLRGRNGEYRFTPEECKKMQQKGYPMDPLKTYRWKQLNSIFKSSYNNEGQMDHYLKNNFGFTLEGFFIDNWGNLLKRVLYKALTLSKKL